MKRLNYDPTVLNYTWKQKEVPRKKVTTVKQMDAGGGKLKNLISNLQAALEKKSEKTKRSKSSFTKLDRQRYEAKHLQTMKQREEELARDRLELERRKASALKAEIERDRKRREQLLAKRRKRIEKQTREQEEKRLTMRMNYEEEKLEQAEAFQLELEELERQYWLEEERTRLEQERIEKERARGSYAQVLREAATRIVEQAEEQKYKQLQDDLVNRRTRGKMTVQS